eukprot:365917-Chlamydomonas_euryale.AAC.7
MSDVRGTATAAGARCGGRASHRGAPHLANTPPTNSAARPDVGARFCDYATAPFLNLPGHHPLTCCSGKRNVARENLTRAGNMPMAPASSSSRGCSRTVRTRRTRRSSERRRCSSAQASSVRPAGRGSSPAGRCPESDHRRRVQSPPPGASRCPRTRGWGARRRCPWSPSRLGVATSHGETRLLVDVELTADARMASSRTASMGARARALEADNGLTAGRSWAQRCPAAGPAMGRLRGSC